MDLSNKIMKLNLKLLLTFSMSVLFSTSTFAQEATNLISDNSNSLGLWLLLIIVLIPALVFIGVLYLKFKDQVTENEEWKKLTTETHFSDYLKNLSSQQIQKFTNLKKSNKLKNNNSNILKTLAFLLFSTSVFAQDPSNPKENFFSQPGIVITIIIVLIPILLAFIFAMVKANNSVKTLINKGKETEAKKFAAHIDSLEDHEIEENLIKREQALDYNLSNSELSGSEKAEDKIGILNNVREKHETHFISLKKKAIRKPSLEPNIAKLIIWYFGCATFWLIVGTGIGEYLGIKFVAPDIDHSSWLSFGRLRPVHTNIVFWGWASLGMIGLGYYVVPIVSNTKIYSVKLGWIALILTNLMVILGTICLMSGINNGGGEFREYIWPVMAFFAVALILTLANFIMTVANRTTKEIYISNWYIVSAIIFTIIVALTAYLPFWQWRLLER